MFQPIISCGASTDISTLTRYTLLGHDIVVRTARGRSDSRLVVSDVVFSRSVKIGLTVTLRLTV
jgi:hypothetical protein